jgi:hypothetical protein
VPISKKALTEAIEQAAIETGKPCLVMPWFPPILAAAKAHAATLKDEGPTLKEITKMLGEGWCDRDGRNYLALGAALLSRLDKTVIPWMRSRLERKREMPLDITQFYKDCGGVMP